MDMPVFFESGLSISESPATVRAFATGTCPVSAMEVSAWVGAYATIYDQSKTKTVLEAVEWLRNDEQNALIIGFANHDEQDQCEPSKEEPIEPRGMVESFLLIDGYHKDIPIVLIAAADKIQEASPEILFLISTSTACEGSGSSNECKWIRKGNPCVREGRDDDRARSCPTGGSGIGFQYGRAYVATSMACIHGFGYAIHECPTTSGTILLTAATSYAGEVEMVHVRGKDTPAHKASFEGRVKATLRCEVRRSGGLNFSTAVAGAGAFVRYVFTSDGQIHDHRVCEREME